MLSLQKQGGFIQLPELLVTIGIVGILMAIAIPKVADIINKSKNPKPSSISTITLYTQDGIKVDEWRGKERRLA